MSNDKIEQVIRGYIPQIIHMSLATVANNKPWVCEVHFSYDDDLNIYFMSSSKSRHAQELLANPQVAANIAVQHHKDQKTRCIDFEGTAEMLASDEAEETAYPAFAARFGESQGLLEQIRKDGDARFFKISVQDFYLFDSYGDERGKHHLPWKSEDNL